jgi:hypothetical protein
VIIGFVRSMGDEDEEEVCEAIDGAWWEVGVDV